jgi:hypothetical protein
MARFNRNPLPKSTFASAVFYEVIQDKNYLELSASCRVVPTRDDSTHNHSPDTFTPTYATNQNRETMTGSEGLAI